jgi:hypothetical protein
VAQLTFAASFIQVKRKELAEGPKGKNGIGYTSHFKNRGYRYFLAKKVIEIFAWIL